MLVNGFNLNRKIRTSGQFDLNRTVSDIAFLAKFGESDSSMHAAFAIYNDGVALYMDFDNSIAYTNNEDFAEFLESQVQN